MSSANSSLARLRPLAFSVAYHMLGSVSDAEDVTQEALLRVAQADDLTNPDAFITTAAARLSLDLLRKARTRRELYVGEWLPEPLVSGAGERVPDAAHRAETADDLSTAFLVLLESLTPMERAAFLLREVFGYEYQEVASILERTEPAVRKLVSRSRRRIQERRPRFSAPPERRDELVGSFLDACERGAVDEFVGLLTEDVVFTGDGGGKAPPGLAITKPVTGIERVTRLLSQFARFTGLVHLEPRTVNGFPGGVVVAAPDLGGGLLAVLSIEVVGGRISHIRSVVNPDKIAHVGPLADLSVVSAHLRTRR